jgi:SAM-dependent methyltransferase
MAREERCRAGLVRSASTDLAVCLACAVSLAAQTHLPDVRFVVTPPATVDAMLAAAKVTRADVVYDLGCGDGRIVIAAAKQYGARGVGIDIVAERIAEARANAAAAGVSDLVRFVQADLLTADFSDATVVTLYLSPSMNERIKPRLLKELRPGARVVSHVYDMTGWVPDQRIEADGRWIFVWTVPDGRFAICDLRNRR